MAEYNEQINQNTIKYLYNLSAVVPDHLKTLKSLYTTRFRIGEEKGNVFLAAHKDRTKLSCPRCCLRLAEGSSKCVIQPEKKPSKFARQVNNKTANGKALTEYQRLYFKRLNLNRNRLVTTCSFCQHVIPRLLTKPPKTPHDVNMNESLVSLVKKKKKKRKNKFCGLDQSVVSLLTPPPAKNAPVAIDLVTPAPATINESSVSLVKKKKKKFCGLDQSVVSLVTPPADSAPVAIDLVTPAPTTKTFKLKSPKKLNFNKNANVQQEQNAKAQQGKNTSKTKEKSPHNKGLKLGNNNRGQTPADKRPTPKNSTRKNNKTKKENRKKLSNLVTKANKNTKNTLNNFLQFLQ